MRRLEEYISADQNISANHLCHTYESDNHRLVFMRLFVDGVSGGGDYTAYLTIQRFGVGDEFYIVPLTITSVDSGYGSICLTTIPIPIHNNDVVRTYLLGQPADTVVDITTEVWEDDSNFYSTAPGAFPTGSLGNVLWSIGTSPTVRVEVPQIDNTKLSIVRGDDYVADHDTAITFSSTQWPDLTGATVTFNTEQVEAIATVTGAQTVMVELTKTQTNLMVNGYFSLVAVFTDSDEVSLIPKSRVVMVDRVATPAA